ncbi:MAG: ABC-type phosphate transport system substrate-binding protein, partial [Pseudoalteromonas tetraodonis]
LYYYFVAAPEGELKKFLEWIKTDEAKEIIVAQGFVAP